MFRTQTSAASNTQYPISRVQTNERACIKDTKESPPFIPAGTLDSEEVQARTPFGIDGKERAG